MCAGAILAAGFNVVVAADDPRAGIDHTADASFAALPADLRAPAQAAFCYPGVRGASPYAREARGAPPPAFFIGKTIAESSQALCSLALEATSGKVQQLLQGDCARAALRDPASLAPSHPIVRQLQSLYPQALAWRGQPHTPDASLTPFLLDAMAIDRRQGGAGDCAALLDAFGNLLLVTPGRRDRSAILTPFMECTRQYAQLRHTLLQGADAALRAEVQQYLGHPRHGSFVLALGPDGSAASFMDLGAWGSTMEGPLPLENPGQFQYVRARMAPAALARLCADMPPLYSIVIGISPRQVGDAALIAALKEGGSGTLCLTRFSIRHCAGA
jgi:cytosine deaminase